MACRLFSRQFLWLFYVLSRRSLTVQFCSLSRLYQAATTFGLSALLPSCHQYCNFFSLHRSTFFNSPHCIALSRRDQSTSSPVYFCCAQRSGKFGRQAVRCCHTPGILHLATLFLLIPRGDSHPRSYPTISECRDVFRFAQGSAAACPSAPGPPCVPDLL